MVKLEVRSGLPVDGKEGGREKTPSHPCAVGVDRMVMGEAVET